MSSGGLRRGKCSVKRQTMILVMIGVILFIAGSAIAYASVEGASKHAGAGANVQAPVSTTAVVAKSDIPAGTTGQAMVSSGMVAIELIPTRAYFPDRPGLALRVDQRGLDAACDQGPRHQLDVPHCQHVLDLVADRAGRVTDHGQRDGRTGRLPPARSRVDVYANITKVSTASNALRARRRCLCRAPSWRWPTSRFSTSRAPSRPTPATRRRRAAPSRANETLLLAVSPSQARTVEFLAQNEALSVVQTQKDTSPPPLGQCIGTDQTASAP